jgi:short-subunit dehydrogenase
MAAVGETVLEGVVLVVGASSGIGRATARLLAARGARLALAARGADALAELDQECRELGARGTRVLPLDVTDLSAVEKAIDDTVAEFGRIDAVVHCAAVLAYGRFHDIPATVFNRVIETNLIGTANVARAALRQFRAQGNGRLILLRSALGKTAIPYSSPYVTSKWAVHGLAAVLRMETRETPGIRVTVVSPGSVDTPIYARAATYFGRQGKPIPPVDPADRVAAQIIRAIESPRRERSIGRANHVLVTAYRLLPGVVDRLAGPVVRRFGFHRNHRAEPTEGNVFEPK